MAVKKVLQGTAEEFKVQGDPGLPETVQEQQEGSERVVRWHGQRGVDYREISSEDWARVGKRLKDGSPAPSVRWDASNGYAVPMSELMSFLTADEFARWIGPDDRLVIEEA